MVVEALARLEAGTLTATPQPAEGVTYAAKLTKDEARVDWSLPAGEIALRLRAYNPAPVAWSECKGERIKLFRAEAVDGTGAAGTVLASDARGLVIACGSGALRVLELQRPGGRVQPAALLAQQGVFAGLHFE